jgi:hypothetical protein
MLRSRNEHAVLHQAGGVAHARDVAARGFYLKVVQVSAAKDDPRAGLRRQQPHVYRCTAVQANAAEFHRRGDGVFGMELGSQHGLLNQGYGTVGTV